jgi:hypothetical protein
MSSEIPKDPSVRSGDQPDQRGGDAPLQVDDSKIVCGYANFIRVTGTPEEMVVDFGLHAQVSGGPAQPVLPGQRTVMNFYTAKQAAPGRAAHDRRAPRSGLRRSGDRRAEAGASAAAIAPTHSHEGP